MLSEHSPNSEILVTVNRTHQLYALYKWNNWYYVDVYYTDIDGVLHRMLYTGTDTPVSGWVLGVENNNTTVYVIRDDDPDATARAGGAVGIVSVSNELAVKTAYTGGPSDPRPLLERPGTPNITTDTFYDAIKEARIYKATDDDWHYKFNRFGCIDPFTRLTSVKEYLFFTRPDLNLISLSTGKINSQLVNVPYFVDMFRRYTPLIYQLQISARGAQENYGVVRYNADSPFINLLCNAVDSTLELPSISARDTETSATIYGTNVSYRGSSYESDEGFDFNLDFDDNKYLEVYNFFKIWDEYERLKALGGISPPRNDYTIYKTLHDQIAIYKFLVAEDGVTIVYFAKLYGVYPKGVPRESFSDGNKSEGITYSVPFHANFVEDMSPLILRDFNELVKPYVAMHKYDMPVYKNGAVNTEWANIPYIYQTNPGGSDSYIRYQLRWR